MNNTLILGKKDSGKTTGYMFSKFKSIISAKENIAKEFENLFKRIVINIAENP